MSIVLPSTVPAADGVSQAPVTRISGAPVGDAGAFMVHLAPANGFPPATYAPLFTPTGWHAFSVGPRPLWLPPPPTAGLRGWAALGTDLADGLARAVPDQRVVGIGHSFGGIATLAAAVHAPERFRALVLLDPTIFPRPTYWALRLALVLGQRVRLPLAQGARRRRAAFAAPDDAFAYWRAKPLFRDWDDAALWAYVDAALERAAGEGFTLRWPPEWEARIYETLEPATWGVLGRVRRLNLPILFVRGETSDVFRAETADAIARLLPQADQATIAGNGHLFPMSAPDRARDAIAGWLARVHAG